MKVCPRCKVNRSENEWSKSSSRKDGLQVYCKVCQKSINSDHYKNSYKEKQVEINRSNRAALRDRVNSYKAVGCCYCQEKDPCCLDFHHVDDNKEAGVSKLVNSQASWDLIECEMNKCIVVCSNCHRKIHAGRDMVCVV